MNTLAVFSREVRSAVRCAGVCVKRNHEENCPNIAFADTRILGADGRVWAVAWTFRPSNGEVMVCWWSSSPQWRTYNGVEITPGLRVFTNDCQWGTVVPEQFHGHGDLDPGGRYFNGWFRVRLEGSGRESLYNGERMSTRLPLGM